MTSFFISNARILFVFFAILFSGCTTLGDSLPPVVYLQWDEDGNAQIYRRDNGSTEKMLTNHPDGIYDFAVSPDAQKIAYSTNLIDGDSTIWLTDPSGQAAQEMLPCYTAECTNMVWAPDNERLLYERREIAKDGLPGSPRLYWLDTTSYETISLFDDRAVLGYGASFSPDGRWLSFNSPEREGVLLVNLDDDRTHFLANEVGTPVAWSPDSKELVVANLDLVILHGDEGEDHMSHTHDFQSAVLLSVFNLESSQRRELSPDMSIDDSNPAWSPDGEWVVIGRKPPRTASGRQLWRMRPDGSAAESLTDDMMLNHGPASWSPDGRYLLFQRFSLNEPSSDPSIWRMNVESGEMVQVAPAGMLPAWLAPLN